MSAPSSQHRTIRDPILLQLAEGKGVTAGVVARRWGEDRVRCQEWLERFAKQGLVRARAARPAGRGRRGNPPPKVYRPDLPAVMAALAGKS